MNNFLATLYAEVGYEQLVRLQYELNATLIRMPETAAFICMGVHKFFS